MTKPWSEMEPRERDALVAEHVMGWHGKSVQASMFQPDLMVTLWYDANGDILNFDHRWALLPPFSTDHTAVRLVEDEIERRGLQYAYSRIVVAQFVVDPNGPLSHVVWHLLRATPEQRCLAALRACGVEI